MASKKDTKAEEKPPPEYVFLLYRGLAMGSSGKLFHRYAELGADWRTKPSDPDDEKRVRLYDKPLSRYGNVGGIYRIEKGKTEGTVIPSTSTLDGVWPLKDQVMQWQAADDMARAEKQRVASEKHWKGRKLYLEALEPVRLAYHKLPFNQRPAFLMAVGRAVTSNKPLLSRKDEDDDE